MIRKRYWIIIGCLFLLGSTSAVRAQRAVLEGLVQDSSQTPLKDVYILLGNTRQYTVTDTDGSFRLTAPPGTYDVVFSYSERTNILRQVTLTVGDTLRRAITLRSDDLEALPAATQRTANEIPTPDESVSTPREETEASERPTAIQHAILRGVVQDSTQVLLKNVYVLLGGTRRHTLTSSSGFFQLAAPPGTYDVVFSYADRTNILRQVTVSEGDTSSFAITLRSNDLLALPAVVERNEPYGAPTPDKPTPPVPQAVTAADERRPTGGSKGTILQGVIQDSLKTTLSDVYVLLGNTRQHTVTDEEFVKAQMQKMIDMRVGPITGFSSGYDYEKDEFKK